MVLVTVVLLLAAAACALAYAYSKLRRTRRAGEPPLVSGHFLLGSGKDFNEDAVTYLRKCTGEYGEVFTMRLLHYWMTVIADPHSFDNFCHEKNFDFEPIQAHVNGQIFGFQVPDYPRMRKFLGKTTKGAAIGRNLASFSENLERALDRLSSGDGDGVGVVDGHAWSGDGLKSLTTKTMFQAIFNTVFGHDKESADFNYSTFWSNMSTFHKYFNYLWIGLPHFLFPAACRAVQRLLVQPSCEDMVRSPNTSDYLRAAVEYMVSYNANERDVRAHNVVYLHINANTFKIAFWCMYHLLSDREAMAAVKAEAEELYQRKAATADAAAAAEEAVTAGQQQQRTIKLTWQELDELKVLDSVISETFRLASGVFMVRQNRKDTQFTVASTGQKFIVRGGDKVCLYPPAIHKDPEIFENPMAFKYDRFVDRKFYKGGKELKNPLLPFGSICPGRKIALLQTKWFVLTMLERYEMALLDGEVAELDVQYHGHEIIPPKRDVQLRYRPLAVYRSLSLVSP